MIEEKNKTGFYFENLDALRFFCFLYVFLFHSFHTEYAHIKSDPIYQFVAFRLFGNGNLGVNFFFVLSGFLITFLLIEEKKETQSINVKNFWTRRVLRIWPLYFFSVAFGFLMFPFFKSLFGQVPNETASPLYYLLFLSNFDLIRSGLPDASILGVLWSVAIEEQFYLLWPVLLFLVRVPNYWIVFSVVLIGSWLFRTVSVNEWHYEYHTLSCIGDMAIGGFGAWLIGFGGVKSFVSRMPKWLIAFLYILLFLFFLFREELLFRIDDVKVFERSIIAMVMLFIILEQNYARNSFFKLGMLKSISYLGKISYGLYCLHFIGILITTNFFKLIGWNDHLWHVLLVETLMALTITIILSMLSYRFLEQPFLRLKKRFAFIPKL